MSDNRPYPPDWLDEAADTLPYVHDANAPTGHKTGDPELSDLLARSPTTFLYFASTSGGLVKIGIAKDVKARERQFNCDSPLPVRIIAYMPAVPELETWLHNEFWLAHYHGEWFHHTEEIDDFIHETEGVLPTRWLGVPTRDYG